MSGPASRASFTPRSLRGTSVQPVNRFSRFHVLSPWRSRIKVPGDLALPIDLRRHLDDARELLGVEARAADQDTVAQRQLSVLLHVIGLDAPPVHDPRR